MNKKDFMNQFNNLDDFSVEEIAKKYPALNKKTKKRILRKCMEKDRFLNDVDFDGEGRITISGTERYNRKPWYKFAASAAALVIAVGGITGAIMLGRNHGGYDISKPENSSAPSFWVKNTDSTSEKSVTTTSSQSSVVGSYNAGNNIDNRVTNADETSRLPLTSKESTVQNPVNSATHTNAPEIPTQSNPHEAQKNYLNNLYYVEMAGVSGYNENRGPYGYMGFEFMPDGTLTKYFFDETGNAIGSTIVKTNYEIVENRFSYGDKAGTIVNPNDSTSFTVQFDDGDIFNFSTQQPMFRKYYFIETKPGTLNGTIWAKCFGDMDENYNYTDRRSIEFKKDGISGTVYILSHPRNVTKSTITEIPFTYEQNGDEIIFHMESSPYAMVKAEISCSPYDKIYGLDVEYLEADESGNTLCCFGQTGSIAVWQY